MNLFDCICIVLNNEVSVGHERALRSFLVVLVDDAVVLVVHVFLA